MMMNLSNPYMETAIASSICKVKEKNSMAPTGVKKKEKKMMLLHQEPLVGVNITGKYTIYIYSCNHALKN